MILATILSLAILLALCRATDNWNYLLGRDDMRRRYAPNSFPDAYEVALRRENKRLLVVALLCGAGLIAYLLSP